MPSFSMAKRDQENEPESSAIEADSPFGGAVILATSDSIDLHPFQPRDIPSVVEEYLEQCIQSGFTKIRLISWQGQRHSAEHRAFSIEQTSGGGVF